MKVELIDPALLETTLLRAAGSPRLRTNHNFHPTMDDAVHRFLNVMMRGTFITPHRHTSPPKSETFVILRGEVAFFLFDENGSIDRCELLGDPASGRACGIDIAPGLWHSLVVLSANAVCFEVKPGPYAAMNDKEFAPWAPREGALGWEEYLAKLSRYAESVAG